MVVLKILSLCAIIRGRSGGGVEFVDDLPFVVFIVGVVAVEERILVVASGGTFIVVSRWRV